MKPIPLNRRLARQPLWLYILIFVVIAALAAVAYLYYLGGRSSGRWAFFTAAATRQEIIDTYALEPGAICDQAPFAFPMRGVPLGLWDQSYRFGHRHAGVDIFPGGEVGETPIYAVYPGYLSRYEDWTSTVITRLPSDPLNPGRQIWVYYTHMADQQGRSFIAEDFPPGTEEVFIEAGRLLGYAGNYSGDPDNPTGLHLHISVVKDDGDGGFLNELEIANTYDPTPYFNLPFNHKSNPDDFPACAGESASADWASGLTDE